MLIYDPLAPPDPETWLELDEQERIALVAGYHRRAKIDMPEPRLHAIAHVVVENQVAMGDAVRTAATIRRLQEEGLDRHQAVHAVGTIVMGMMHRLLHPDGDRPANVQATLDAQMDTLTAGAWLAGDALPAEG